MTVPTETEHVAADIPAISSQRTKPQQKEWTLMFYFASDDPLAPSIVSQLKAIKEAGYDPDANVIAQFDPHTVNTPAHVFDVNLVNKLRDPGGQVGFRANDPFVRNLVLDKLWGEGDEAIRESIRVFLNKESERRPLSEDTNTALAAWPDEEDDEGMNCDEPNGNGSDRPRTERAKIEYDPPQPSLEMAGEPNPKDALANFLLFCRQHYPARHYILFILGHGIVVGNDLFLLDEHAPQKSLSLRDFGTVLGEFKLDIEQDHGELELIGFHSCSMSALEVAYELQGKAKYMLASQGPAFVGSWPYRQILIRIFNDLRPRFSRADLKDAASLATELKHGTEPVTAYLRELLDPAFRKMLDQYDSNQQPDRPLRKGLLKELNRLLENAELRKAEVFRQLQLPENVRQLLDQDLGERDLKRLNRYLLMEAYPKAITNPILRMLKKIFHYCLYNSYDFQLAGYSFDLALCDLRRTRDLDEPLATLASELIAGLKDGSRPNHPDPLVKDLILLAHWDAQSYWQENYTDIYDFCFRLDQRCKGARPASPETATRLGAIRTQCGKIMEKLSGVTNDERIILRSGFAGPTYQYSHGLSVFFPWSNPVGSQMWEEEYAKYKLNRKTSWKKFLDAYFELTMRKPHVEEKDDNCPASPASMDQELLELLKTVTSRIFNSDGQLSKSGPEDRTGKYGPEDPTGGDCDCPSFKNYPFITRSRKTADVKRVPSENEPVPVSPDFFTAFRFR